MIKEIYLKTIKQVISDNFQKDCKYFIYGSSIKKDDFGDIDLGLLGANVNSNYIFALKDTFDSSTFPHKVDIIDFNKVDDDFKNNVFKEDVLWLT